MSKAFTVKKQTTRYFARNEPCFQDGAQFLAHASTTRRRPARSFMSRPRAGVVVRAFKVQGPTMAAWSASDLACLNRIDRAAGRVGISPGDPCSWHSSCAVWPCECCPCARFPWLWRGQGEGGGIQGRDGMCTSNAPENLWVNRWARSSRSSRSF